MKIYNSFNEMFNDRSGLKSNKSVFNFENGYDSTYWGGVESFEKSCVDNLVDWFGDLVDYYNKTNGGVYNGEYEDIFDEWYIKGQSEVVYDYVMQHETNFLDSCKLIINDLGDEDESADDYENSNDIYDRAERLLDDYWDRNRDAIFGRADSIISKKYPEIYYGTDDFRGVIR